jgi:hypothetical protein
MQAGDRPVAGVATFSAPGALCSEPNSPQIHCYHANTGMEVKRFEENRGQTELSRQCMQEL